MANFFPGMMPGDPVATSEVATVAMKPVVLLQQPQSEQEADTTPHSESNRLTDYQSGKWDPIHRQPAILKASNQDCLKCHNEILSRKVLPESPAGLLASETLAWYQTLDTYEGEQETFHWRHLESPYARKVMNLKCNFCHKGNDPREEAPFANGDPSDFTLRKSVVPTETCLKCHGQMNWKVMTLPTPMQGPWHRVRDTYQNDCLSCHAIYRTVRHQVTYLNAEKIEELAKPENLGGDVCYGCHGGRAWYINGYPYPRHEYPGMDKIPDPHPEWAKDRPTESDPQYALPIKMPAVPGQPATAAPLTAGPAPGQGSLPTQAATPDVQPAETSTPSSDPQTAKPVADEEDSVQQTQGAPTSSEASSEQKPNLNGTVSASKDDAKKDDAKKDDAKKDDAKKDESENKEAGK